MKTILPIRIIADDCVNCGICVKECAFLQEYGSPQKLASDWLDPADNNTLHRGSSFECSLCGLCHGLCPKELDPSAMFLAMRRELVAHGEARFKQHNTIRAYEKRGSSTLFSWYCFPSDCNTIFFPGCALPGSRPNTLTRLFAVLQKLIPNIGLVFDCCTKPSHDLGDSAHFTAMFQELCTILREHKITKVLVACPNCYRIFSEYGEGLDVVTVYEELARAEQFHGQHEKTITIHDPCGVRYGASVQTSIRTLLKRQNLTVLEMKHREQTSFCCGEGGSAGFLRPDFARKWTEKRVQEADGLPMASYCAGCTHFLGNSAETFHILDLLLFPEATLANRVKVSKAPFTYWNRYRLKKRMQKLLPSAISGSRNDLTHRSSHLSD